MSRERRFGVPDLRKEAEKLFSHVGSALQTSPFASRSAPITSRPTPRNLIADDRFAALSFGKVWRWSVGRLKKKEDPDADYEELKRQWEALSPEKREQLHDMHMLSKVVDQRFEHKGKMMTAPEAIKAIDDEIADINRSIGIDTMEDIGKKHNYLDLLRWLPNQYLRRDAPKQQMKKSEERRLELTRLTSGVCDKGLWGGKQYAFGIFAREQILGQLMHRWSRLSLLEAVGSSAFYLDMMACSRAAEFTLMVVPRKKLSINQLQWEYQHKLRKSIAKFTGSEKLSIELRDFLQLFDSERLANCNFVDGTRVLPDTKILFTTQNNGDLLVEAINPGPLRDQKTTILGFATHPLLTAAVFDLFFGETPIDGRAKMRLANNVIHIAQGNSLEQLPGESLEDDEEQARREAVEENKRMERMQIFLKKRPPKKHPETDNQIFSS